MKVVKYIAVALLAILGILMAFIVNIHFRQKIEYEYTLEEGLIAHWTLDKIVGGKILDSIGELHGTVVGSVKVAKGVIGNAVYFNGKGYIKFSKKTIETLGKLKKGSISLWFKYIDVLNKQEILPIFYLGISSENKTDNMFIIEIGHAKPGNKKLYVTWVINGKPVLCFDSRVNLESGKWYHLVVVVSYHGNTAYLNGVELTNRHYNFGSPKMRLFLADIPSKELLAIGYGKTAKKKSPHFLYFYGAVDDVRVYSRALTADEVKKLYEEAKG